MGFYLGIDGGGTKTRCILADETTVLAKAMTGGCSMIRHGEQQVREALHSAIHQVCAIARITPNQIHAICIGVTGAGRAEIAAKIRSILAELAPQVAPANVEVVGDTVIALEAAFGVGPGVIAIAGTGSIVYGRDAAGHTARAGGWGFAISDEGSGYWIGRRAISAILNAHDQGLETTLTAMVFQAWKMSSIDELVLAGNATTAPDFPRLFPIVLRASDEKDAVARDLLVEAGAELARIAAIVMRRLAPNAPKAMLPVATTGSVFRQSQVVRQVFYNTLQASFPGIEIHQEPADPVAGALARARRQ
jgi:glucosamine kinase